MGQVTLRGIRKRYGDHEVIQGIDLDVRDGEFMVFVGPSGCGKSTTLRMIAGLEEISGGDLLIDGHRANELRPADRGAAMVFQSYALYPHMTVAENMGFALKMAGVGRAERDEQVRRTAEILRITDLLQRTPKQLSGGQRQRVAIGRAIVRKPEVFLFDEPLSNLDAALRVRMRYEFAKLHEDLKTTMVYVTHDQVEAMTLADRIVVLSAGTIEQVGTPLELYEHPDNLFVAGFIGSPKMNFIEAEVVTAGADHATVRLGDGAMIRTRVDASRARAGDKVTLGLRPEHFEVGGDANLIASTVTFVESLGGVTHAYCAYPGVEDALTCEFDGRTRVRAGDTLQLHLPPDLCYLFDAQGLAFKRLGAAA